MNAKQEQVEAEVSVDREEDMGDEGSSAQDARQPPNEQVDGESIPTTGELPLRG